MSISNNGASSSSDPQEASYAYEVRIIGAGRRIVIGTLPKEVMTYLASKDQDELTDFLFSKVGDRPKMVGLEKVKVPAWNRINDVLHLHGVQADRANVVVEDDKGAVIFEVDEGELRNSALVSVSSKMQAASPSGTDRIQSMTTEKIGLVYPFTTIAPFDAAKLQLNLVQVDEEAYVQEVSYDGETLIENDRHTREITPPMSFIV